MENKDCPDCLFRILLFEVINMNKLIDRIIIIVQPLCCYVVIIFHRIEKNIYLLNLLISHLIILLIS